jgi:phage tail-like protein
MPGSSISNDAALVRAFRFDVALQLSPGSVGQASADANATALGDGSFQECSGLQIDLEVQDFNEGGRNDGVVRRVGRARYSPLVLKRGMFHAPGGRADSAIWAWLQAVADGSYPVRRYDGVVTVWSPNHAAIVAEWTFDRSLPLRVVGPTLNAVTGEVAIEELHLAHEGLRLATR